MFVKELVIKEKILDKSNTIKDEFIQKSKELTMKLKMPRFHMQFLKEKGSLDEFVAAKLTGEEPTAKWLLLDNAKDELKDIQKETKRKEELMKQKHIQQVKPPKLDFQESLDSYDTSDMMGKFKKKYVLSSSLH